MIDVFTKNLVIYIFLYIYINIYIYIYWLDDLYYIWLYMCVCVCVLARRYILLLTIFNYIYIYIYTYWLDDQDFSPIDNCTNFEVPIGKTAEYLSIQFNKMHLTKPLSKMLSNLLKLVKLNMVTDVPSRKSMYPQREISRNYWTWCPILAAKKKYL